MGIIQTKSAWYNQNNRCWYFSTFEKEWYKEYDNSILHCISGFGKRIERTYIIPSWEIIGRKTIKIIKSPSSGGWYED